MKSHLRVESVVRFDSALNTAITEACNKPAKLKTEPTGLQKLSDGDVIVIKSLYHIAGWDYGQINEVFNTVTRTTIGDIILRKSRKSVQLNFMTKIPDAFYELVGESYRSKKVRGTK